MIPTYDLRCSAEELPVVWAHVPALSGGAHCWSALRVPLTLSAPRSAATGEMREMRTHGGPKVKTPVEQVKVLGGGQGAHPGHPVQEGPRVRSRWRSHSEWQGEHWQWEGGARVQGPYRFPTMPVLGALRHLNPNV